MPASRDLLRTLMFGSWFVFGIWASDTVVAATPQPGPPVAIVRAPGPIVIDGRLDDAGWRGVEGVTTWYETRVGDNAEPPVKNTGYLAYDEQFLYAGFRFEDPDPKRIRAPIADHDQLSGSTDYGGIIVDSNNDGKTAVMFLANPNGLEYDAVTNDATGEDNSPDYYWDSAGRIHDGGWDLEIRIPFSSLRYASAEQPTWRVMLYRNYPRDRHYQFFSTRLPRDVSCFICNSSPLTGLANLPQGSHLVVAPYATAQRVDTQQGTLGSPLDRGDLDHEFGGDLKWSPFANLAIDATVHPDFSQVESDAAQIGDNERFALFFPERRSFFLEGIDLFSTPLQAVYTRSITAPDAGLRATGRVANTAFTALVARDRGQGSVIIPGPEGSAFADQDFRSDVGIVRMRRDVGPSFVSVLAAGRSVQGGGHNVVFGPDFQWRPRPSDAITGQAMWSDSRTPNRPDLADEWDGRALGDHALLLRWAHNTAKTDVFVQGQDLGPDFRADEGFIPQVGYREIYFETGYTVRPKDAFLSRLRAWTVNWYDEDHDGRVLARRVSAGAGMDGQWNSTFRFELNRDDIRSGDRLFARFRPVLIFGLTPGRILNQINVDVAFGDEIDFRYDRMGNGVSLNGSITLRPDDHLELRGNASTRWLNVDDPTLGSGRLFLAQVERVRATYSFSSRTFVRLIGQYSQTSREPALFPEPSPVSRKTAGFDASALFAHKLNWQTVLYLGYGDERTFANSTDRLEPSGRQGFAKISYAFQR